MSLPEPTRERWTALRAGIVDVWEFDNQEFRFHKGRLILRGRNESGKSKTLELLLPFLLDASTRPERLSAERNTSRRMIWNLLNERNPERKIRTGYVWMEFGRCDDGGSKFITVGAGLHARRDGGSSVQSWYFISPQRVGQGLALTNDKDEVVSRRQLPEILGETGHVFDSGAEYRAHLNRQLFDMEDEQYEALIHTLLELRQPKLSKNLDIDRVGALLSESLPPLDAGIIGQLATDFEELEEHRREVAARRQAGLDVRDALKVVRRYAALQTRALGDSLTSADSQYHKANSRLRQHQEAVEACTGELADTRDRQMANETSIRANRSALEVLLASEAYQTVQQIGGRKDNRKRMADDLATQERASEAADTAAAEAEGRRKEQETAAAKATEDEATSWDRALAVARTAEIDVDSWGDWRGGAQTWSKNDAKTEIRKVLAEPTAVHAELDASSGEVRQANQDLQTAARREQEAHDELRSARDRRDERLRDHEEAEIAFRAAVQDWFAGTPWTSSADVAGADLDPDSLGELARRLASSERARLGEDLSQIAVDRAPKVARRGEVEAEIEVLESTTHSPPVPPTWRQRVATDAGSPFYLLCDFRPDVVSAQRAAMEGSMLAAGLLDSWVTQDGSILDSGADIWSAPLRPCDGPSLASVLVPSQDAPLPRDLVQRILESVPFTEDASAGEGFDPDGGWRFGALYGRSPAAEARYIGETARQAERERRLQELRDELVALSRTLAALEEREAELRNQIQAVDQHASRFPSSKPLTAAESALAAANDEVDRRQGALDQASGRLAVAKEKVQRAEDKLREAARRLHREHWISRLSELGELLASTKHHLEEWSRDARDAGQARRHLAEATTLAEEAKERAVVAGGQVQEHRRRLEAEDAAIAALTEALGKSPEEVLAQVDRLKSRDRALEKQRKELSSEEVERASKLSKAESEAKAAEGEVQSREGARDQALEDLKRALGSGLPRLALGEPDDRVVSTLTDAMDLAREVAKRHASLIPEPATLERQENRLVQAFDELKRKLPREFALEQERRGGVVVILARSGDETLALDVLEQRLRAQVAEQEQLLEDEEGQVLANFLTGSTRRHLRERLVRAQELVDRANQVLDGCPTPQGTRLRLRWRLASDAPADAERAVTILRLDSDVQTTADRQALQQFLQDRLNQARTEEGSLKDRMLELLDYRRWHHFDLETTKPEQQGWRRLTKKAHGAGSGGQKAVLLHLPLFAAASAFYDSASEIAPRLVLMDEAFAGVDTPMRAELLGLLCRLQLDFVLTSHSEWGCYSTVDGTAIYHLSRDKAFPGVLAERYVWDGTVREAMGSR